jgi:hypothetical protein
MAGEICPNTGDMDKCKRKPRCKWGACEGQSLPSDDEDYCPAGYTFREDYCDCSPEIDCSQPLRSATIKWKVRYATYGSGCSPATTSCFAFGGNPYTRLIDDLADGSTIEVGTQETEVIGTCSGTNNTTTVATYQSCIDGSPAFRTINLVGGGCSVNTSAGAIATPYEVEVIYS